MPTFRWGMFGTGAMSAKFVAGLKYASDARPVMVASRRADAARAFAGIFDIERAVEGYAEAARAGGVDAVYIATPPAQHVEHALACIAAGLPVLIEKPFAMNESQARRITDAARAAGVFCMEGLWTRFVPAAQRARDLIRDGAVGEPRQISGSFGTGYRPDPEHGNFDLARGGGALSHLGVYPLSLAQWMFGSPTVVMADCRLGETGVDEDVVMALRYRGDVLASFHASLRANAANDFRIIGTQGAVAFQGPIFRPHGLEVRRATPRGRANVDFGLKSRLRETHLAQTLNQWLSRSGLRHIPVERRFYGGNGYHYEADEVRRCVAAGAFESAVMPLDDSIDVAATTDRVRRAMTNSRSGDQAR